MSVYLTYVAVCCAVVGLGLPGGCFVIGWLFCVFIRYLSVGWR